MSDPAATLVRALRRTGLHRVGTRPDRWIDDHGAAVVDPVVLARLSALALPPAWSDVWASSDAGARVQATGVDARGRTQYRYSAEALDLAARDKFHHVLDFGAGLPELRAHVQAHLDPEDGDRPSVRRATAAIVRILDRGLLRVGNGRYARDNHTYGLTTLAAEHVAVHGPAIEFAFVGKEHRPWHVVLEDEPVAAVIGELLAHAETPSAPLFAVGPPGRRQEVTSAAVNAYIHGLTRVAASAKTFRTWGGTAIAAAVAAGATADGIAHSRRADLAPVDVAAAMLGNTRAVARASYVHPAAIEAGRSPEVVAAVDAAADRVGSRDVHAVLDDPAVVRAVAGRLGVADASAAA
ncbi:DNA topoisomerase IB [Amnibacterium setariae]|uniref:DNA topoisomerase n=1 Tax=Amnibacterium setariae TaxID=2306585 RepID=A0A3A1TXP9_9MICO|nr:DNA topoisomerase IB [Amnibacterium setariae]RIX28550.1 DNA topoisomerase IB [Amnibacterium setariae]